MSESQHEQNPEQQLSACQIILTFPQPDRKKLRALVSLCESNGLPSVFKVGLYETARRQRLATKAKAAAERSADKAKLAWDAVKNTAEAFANGAQIDAFPDLELDDLEGELDEDDDAPPKEHKNKKGGANVVPVGPPAPASNAPASAALDPAAAIPPADTSASTAVPADMRPVAVIEAIRAALTGAILEPAIGYYTAEMPTDELQAFLDGVPVESNVPGAATLSGLLLALHHLTGPDTFDDVTKFRGLCVIEQLLELGNEQKIGEKYDSVVRAFKQLTPARPMIGKILPYLLDVVDGHADIKFVAAHWLGLALDVWAHWDGELLTRTRARQINAELNNREIEDAQAKADEPDAAAIEAEGKAAYHGGAPKKSNLHEKGSASSGHWDRGWEVGKAESKAARKAKTEAAAKAAAGMPPNLEAAHALDAAREAYNRGWQARLDGEPRPTASDANADYLNGWDAAPPPAVSKAPETIAVMAEPDIATALVGNAKSKEYRAGCKARRAGISRPSCPFHPNGFEQQMVDWCLGWDTTHDEIMDATADQAGDAEPAP